MIQSVEYSHSLWNGKRKCLDLEFPNHMIGCKGYFWRGDGFNRIWVSSTKHGDTIDLHWVLTINPFNFEITSWSQLNHWISFVFCRFCHVLSLLKRTQRPLNPFDSPQVFWKPRSSSTSASRSCAGLKPLEMLTLEPHFSGSAVIEAENEKLGLKMIVLSEKLWFFVVSGLFSWYPILIFNTHSMFPKRSYPLMVGLTWGVQYSPEGILKHDWRVSSCA